MHMLGASQVTNSVKGQRPHRSSPKNAWPLSVTPTHPQLFRQVPQRHQEPLTTHLTPTPTPTPLAPGSIACTGAPAGWAVHPRDGASSVHSPALSCDIGSARTPGLPDTRPTGRHRRVLLGHLGSLLTLLSGALPRAEDGPQHSSRPVPQTRGHWRGGAVPCFPAERPLEGTGLCGGPVVCRRQTRAASARPEPP